MRFEWWEGAKAYRVYDGYKYAGIVYRPYGLAKHTRWWSAQSNSKGLNANGFVSRKYAAQFLLDNN